MFPLESDIADLNPWFLFTTCFVTGSIAPQKSLPHLIHEELAYNFPSFRPWREISLSKYGFKNISQVLPSDLFGCFEWPFQGLSDLRLGDQKVTKKLYGWWFCGCLVYGVVGEGVVADKKKIANAKGRQYKLGHPIRGRSENTKEIICVSARTVYIYIYKYTYSYRYIMWIGWISHVLTSPSKLWNKIMTTC